MRVLDDQIVAALIWDVPTLRRSGESATSFADAMVGKANKWWEPETFSDDILGRAGRAVAYERANQVAEAVAGYEELVADNDPGAHLLGLMLRAWSQSGDLGSVRKAREALDGVDLSDDLRAQLLTKVATYAFDAGDHEVGQEAFAEALALAPRAGRLHWYLAFEGLNYGLADSSPPLGDLAPPAEPLTDYPWIMDYVSASAERALKAEVDRRSRRAWTWTFRLGGQPVYADALSAEVQTTWAGALWLRRSVRLHLGGLLLTGAAETPRHWAYGLLMWTLGGGSDPRAAYRLTEPRLDADGIEFVISELWKGARPNDRLNAVRIADEAWDAISDHTLQRLVAELEPRASEHPIAEDVRQLWAAYAARLPDAWFADLQKQPSEVQMALVSSLGPGVIAHLSANARRYVWDLAREQLSVGETADPHTMLIAATAAPENGQTELGRLLAEMADASALGRLPEEVASLAGEERLSEARQELMARVREQEAESRRGSVSFGSFDLRLALGRLAAQADDPHATALLMEIAVASDLPADHIAAARNILVLLRREGRLGPSDIAALHEAEDDVGTFPEHAGIFEDTLRARRLEILATELAEDEVALVVAGCRAPVARVRMISLATCAQAVETGGGGSDYDAMLWSLVGGLSDPDDEVVAAALNHLPEAQIEANPSAARLTVERMVPLMGEANREVRCSIAELARRWLVCGSRHEDRLAQILEKAARDKSWLVRESGGKGD